MLDFYVSFYEAVRTLVVNPPILTNCIRRISYAISMSNDYHLILQLQQDLRAGALKGGVEDSAVVSRVLEKYLEPMQENMVGVAPLMELAGRDTRERARLLPLLMKVRDPDGKTRAIVVSR